MEEVVSEEEPPGGTPMYRAVKLGKNLRMNHLFIKFEGANRTGTQKDRISRLHVRNAILNGYDTISVATCGNYGASLSYYAAVHGMKSVIGIPDHYSNSRIEEMLHNGSTILKVPGMYEEAVDYVSEKAAFEGWYDSNPGSINSHLDIAGYEGIAFEIVEQLGNAPSYVSVPVGNGTTLAGIYSGFRKLKEKGVIGRLPGMIGSSTSSGNPIVESWKKGLRKMEDMKPEEITETPMNEPLVAYRSIDGQKALNAIYESRGFACYVSDQDMLRFSRAAELSEGISVLPASAAAIAALRSLSRDSAEDLEIVAVVTGRNQVWTTR